MPILGDLECPYDHSDIARIWVRFRHGDRHLRVRGYIDSGATRTVIPGKVARFLGLNVSGNENAIGLIGSVQIGHTSVRMLIGNVEENNARLYTRVKVMVSHSDECPVLVGQRPFFKDHLIEFDGRNGRATVRPNTF